jgi:RNA polymerase sigma-70 factor (ECF subfamily)
VDPLSQLLADARDGNQYALELFVRQTQRDVWAVCRNLGDTDNVEDLVQDSYARALRSLKSFRGEGSARSWILSVARNTCVDAARQRQRRRRWRDEREAPELAYEHSDQSLVDDLLAGLDHDRREAFVLTQMAGCSYESAAAIIGCPIGTVRSRVARARADLLRVIEARDESA